MEWVERLNQSINAFQSFHGIAPSSVKDEGVSVKSFSPIVFRIAVKGGTEMNYKTETKDAFRIIGVSAPLNKEIEKNFMVVPKMWQEASVNGTIQKLAGMMDTPPMGFLGVSACIYLGNLFRNKYKSVNAGIRAADYNRVASDLRI